METPYNNSKLITQMDTFIVPQWIFEDVIHFYPNIEEHIISETNENIIFNIDYKKEFIQLRKQIYWLCQWYDELINKNIPTIDSIIMTYDEFNEIDSDDEKFIRLCNASPKDIKLPIFNLLDKEDINKTLLTSNRTKYMFNNKYHKPHVVLRDIVNIDYEVRCFWHKYKLRAISGPINYVDVDTQHKIKQLVLQFFDDHGKKIIYNSVTIDIGICKDNVFIIEFNSFGIDMIASAEYFDWFEDFNILYNSIEPIFKFKNEFEF